MRFRFSDWPAMLTSRTAFAFSFLVLSGTVGCVALRDNSVRQARAERERRVGEREPANLSRREFVADLEVEERRARLAATEDEIVVARTRQAAASAALDEVLQIVRALEDDLKAARRRKTEIEAQLVPLRDLEEKIDTAGKRVEELRAELAAKQGEAEKLSRDREALEQKLGSLRSEVEAGAVRLTAEIEALTELRARIEAQLGSAQAPAGKPKPEGPTPEQANPKKATPKPADPRKPDGGGKRP